MITKRKKAIWFLPVLCFKTAALSQVVFFYICSSLCYIIVRFLSLVIYDIACQMPLHATLATMWWIWPFGLQFAAGMSILVYGVRQFIAEITAAFELIPCTSPQLTALQSSHLHQTLSSSALLALSLRPCSNGTGWPHSPTIMIPAAGICFFSGGMVFVVTLTVDGAVLSRFLLGWHLPGRWSLILYPAFAQLGICRGILP